MSKKTVLLLVLVIGLSSLTVIPIEPQALAVMNGLINERVEDDDFILYVNRVSETTIAGDRQSEIGFKFLIIDISIKNKFDSPKRLDSSIKVSASDGYNYSYTGQSGLINSTIPFSEIEVLTGDIVRRIWPVQIPNDASGLYLYYSDTSFPRENYRFIIDITLNKTPSDPPLKSEIIFKQNKNLYTTILIEDRIRGREGEIRFKLIDERIESQVGIIYPPELELKSKYFVIEMKIENFSNETLAIDSFLFFWIKSDKGFIYPNIGSISNGLPIFDRIQLSPSQEKDIEQVFLINENEDKFMLMFQDRDLVLKSLNEKLTVMSNQQRNTSSFEQVETSSNQDLTLLVGIVIIGLILVFIIIILRGRNTNTEYQENSFTNNPE